MKTTRILAAVLLLAAHCGLSGPIPSDSLGPPLPAASRRDFDTDRPDKTNSPHTLDFGHCQVEAGLFSYSRTTRSGVLTQNETWADTTLRVALTQWAEVQLEAPLYQSNRVTEVAVHDTQRTCGVGDLTATLKGNLWGNDTGDSAGGAALWVKSPTASHNLSNGQVEGGMVFLLGLKLPEDFDLGINNGLGISVNDQNVYHADLINSLSLSHPIAGPWSGYVEFFSSIPTQASGNWVGTLDLGVLLMLGKNCQLDSGVNLGVTPGADACQPFLGISCRF